jgi:hypothetical protein
MGEDGSVPVTPPPDARQVADEVIGQDVANSPVLMTDLGVGVMEDPEGAG